MTPTPKIHLEASDAAELAEMLSFIADWLQHDQDGLEPLLRGFVGGAAYDIDTLRTDVARHAFLLGDDGTRLFDTDQP